MKDKNLIHMLRKRNQHELLIPAALLFLTDSDQGDEDNNNAAACSAR